MSGSVYRIPESEREDAAKWLEALAAAVRSGECTFVAAVQFLDRIDLFCPTDSAALGLAALLQSETTSRLQKCMRPSPPKP